jgi:hypothetical protein
MEVGSLVALAVTFSAALLVSWTLLLPFFSNEENEAEETDGELNAAVQFNELHRRRENTFAALEELENELSSGKISQEEYELSKAELTRDAAQYLQQIEDAEVRIANTEDTSSGEDTEHESNSN